RTTSRTLGKRRVGPDYGQMNLKTFATTSPSVSSIATHTKADVKLAIWKRQNGIAKMPATRGTTARKGPENRPMKMASEPHLATKRSPGGRRSGWRDSGQIRTTDGPSLVPIQ